MMKYMLMAIPLALGGLVLLILTWGHVSFPFTMLFSAPLWIALLLWYTGSKLFHATLEAERAPALVLKSQAQVHSETAAKTSEEAETLRVQRECDQARLDFEKQFKMQELAIKLRAQEFEQWKERTWVAPTQYGMLQVQDDGTIQHHLPARIDRAGASKQVMHDETAGDAEPGLTIPKAPTFREMSHLIQKGRIPLCFVWSKEQGMSVPAYGTITDLLSMGVTGKPGRGKTTGLMYYVTFLLKNGAEVWIWDPHGVMAELSVLNGRVLPNMPASAKLVYLDRKEDIIRSAPLLLNELNVRDEVYRQKDTETGKRAVKHPFMLLADELPVLADYDDDLKAVNKRLVKQGMQEKPALIDVIKRIVLEARKWNCFFIGSGQSLDAQVLPTRVVESFNSRIVFFSSDRRARMSGLENDSIENLLPAIRRAGPGVMVFDCARWDEPLIGAIPDITVEDMLDFLGVPLHGEGLQEFSRAEADPQDTDPLAQDVRSDRSVMTVSADVSYPKRPVSGNETASEANQNNIVPLFRVSAQEEKSSSRTHTVSDETKRTIARMYKTGHMRARDIAPLVGLGGDKYKLFQEVCTELGIDTKNPVSAEEVQ